MAQLLVRNLDDDVKERLKRQAKAHGRSVEAEARQILTDGVGATAPETDRLPGEGLGTWLARKQAENPIPDDVWEEFERSLGRVRKTGRMRKVEFPE